MNVLAQADKEPTFSSRRRALSGDFILLGCSVLSLIASCLIISARKQAWMDEIMTWQEASDRSLWHLYWAIQHGADGGQPFFYTTVWLWRHIFGGGVLTLRLYSCAAMCGALIVTWKTIRRYYGLWATAIGTLMIWGTSSTVLDQNAEARFYGLYMLTVTVAIYCYCRLVEEPNPTRRLLLGTLLAQAALVLTHVLGLIYGGLILLALALSDARRRRFRPKVYLCYVAGWLALLIWIPAVRASMAAGKPRGWIPMPTFHGMLDSYGFATNVELLSVLQSHAWRIFQPARYLAELLILIPVIVTVVFLVRTGLSRQERRDPEPRADLLLVAFALLLMPPLLFLLSHLITPVLIPRYLLPSSIGMAIILTAFADLAGADRQHLSQIPRFAWTLIVLALLASPIASAFVMRTPFAFSDYLDIRSLESDIPPGAVMVVDQESDFSRLMRYARHPQSFYYLLDWPTALAGPRASVLDYHLMRAYRDAGYYAPSIQEEDSFLCAHADFYVLDAKSPSLDGVNWFDTTIRKRPEFEWKAVDIVQAPDYKRTLFLVHEVRPLPACR